MEEESMEDGEMQNDDASETQGQNSLDLYDDMLFEEPLPNVKRPQKPNRPPPEEDSVDLYSEFLGENSNCNNDVTHPKLTTEQNASSNKVGNTVVEHVEKSKNLATEDSPDLDLFTEVLADELQQKHDATTELQRKCSQAEERIKELEFQLKQEKEKSEKILAENVVIKKNISALLLTAKAEIKRKDCEIQRLNNLVTKKNVQQLRRCSTSSPSSRERRNEYDLNSERAGFSDRDSTPSKSDYAKRKRNDSNLGTPKRPKLNSQQCRTPDRHSRERSPKGHSRERSPKGHSRDRSPKGQSRDKSSKSHSRDRSPVRRYSQDKSPVRRNSREKSLDKQHNGNKSPDRKTSNHRASVKTRIGSKSGIGDAKSKTSNTSESSKSGSKLGSKSEKQSNNGDYDRNKLKANEDKSLKDSSRSDGKSVKKSSSVDLRDILKKKRESRSSTNIENNPDTSTKKRHSSNKENSETKNVTGKNKSKNIKELPEKSLKNCIGDTKKQIQEKDIDDLCSEPGMKNECKGANSETAERSKNSGCDSVNRCAVTSVLISEANKESFTLCKNPTETETSSAVEQNHIEKPKDETYPCIPVSKKEKRRITPITLSSKKQIEASNSDGQSWSDAVIHNIEMRETMYFAQAKVVHIDHEQSSEPGSSTDVSRTNSTCDVSSTDVSRTNSTCHVSATDVSRTNSTCDIGRDKLDQVNAQVSSVQNHDSLSAESSQPEYTHSKTVIQFSKEANEHLLLCTAIPDGEASLTSVTSEESRGTSVALVPSDCSLALMMEEESCSRTTPFDYSKPDNRPTSTECKDKRNCDEGEHNSSMSESLVKCSMEALLRVGGPKLLKPSDSSHASGDNKHSETSTNLKPLVSVRQSSSDSVPCIDARLNDLTRPYHPQPFEFSGFPKSYAKCVTDQFSPFENREPVTEEALKSETVSNSEMVTCDDKPLVLFDRQVSMDSDISMEVDVSFDAKTENHTDKKEKSALSLIPQVDSIECNSSGFLPQSIITSPDLKVSSDILAEGIRANSSPNKETELSCESGLISNDRMTSELSTPIKLEIGKIVTESLASESILSEDVKDENTPSDTEKDDVAQQHQPEEHPIDFSVKIESKSRNTGCSLPPRRSSAEGYSLSNDGAMDLSHRDIQLSQNSSDEKLSQSMDNSLDDKLPCEPTSDKTLGETPKENEIKSPNRSIHSANSSFTILTPNISLRSEGNESDISSATSTPKNDKMSSSSSATVKTDKSKSDTCASKSSSSLIVTDSSGTSIGSSCLSKTQEATEATATCASKSSSSQAVTDSSGTSIESSSPSETHETIEAICSTNVDPSIASSATSACTSKTSISDKNSPSKLSDGVSETNSEYVDSSDSDSEVFDISVTDFDHHCESSQSQLLIQSMSSSGTPIKVSTLQLDLQLSDDSSISCKESLENILSSKSGTKVTDGNEEDSVFKLPDMSTSAFARLNYQSESSKKVVSHKDMHEENYNKFSIHPDENSVLSLLADSCDGFDCEPGDHKDDCRKHLMDDPAEPDEPDLELYIESNSEEKHIPLNGACESGEEDLEEGEVSEEETAERTSIRGPTVTEEESQELTELLKAKKLLEAKISGIRENPLSSRSSDHSNKQGSRRNSRDEKRRRPSRDSRERDSQGKKSSSRDHSRDARSSDPRLTKSSSRHYSDGSRHKRHSPSAAHNRADKSRERRRDVSPIRGAGNRKQTKENHRRENPYWIAARQRILSRESESDRSKSKTVSRESESDRNKSKTVSRESESDRSKSKSSGSRKSSRDSR